MGDAEAAKVDCSRVLERVPNNAKALFRRAQAELELKVCLSWRGACQCSCLEMLLQIYARARHQRQ